MLVHAVPPALAAAIYPQALLFIAIILGRPRPQQHALVFLAGAGVVTLGVGVAAVLLLQGTGLEGPRHPTVPPWIDLALGAVLLLVAVVVWFRPPGRRKDAEHRELGVLGLFAIGLLMYSPSPFYLASLHAIAEAHAGTVATFASVALVAALYMLMAEVPIVAHAFWPEATVRRVSGLNGWLSRHGRTLICLVAAALGAYLVISGVTRLT